MGKSLKRQTKLSQLEGGREGRGGEGRGGQGRGGEGRGGEGRGGEGRGGEGRGEGRTHTCCYKVCRNKSKSAVFLGP